MSYSNENTVLQDPVLAIYTGGSSANAMFTDPCTYTCGDRVVRVPAQTLPTLPVTPIPTGYTGVYSVYGDYFGNIAWVQGTSYATPTVYNFVVSGVTTMPVAGTIYTNNSHTFTVLGGTSSGTAGALIGSIACTGTGAPSSGNLVKSTTQNTNLAFGDATIAFSSTYTSTYVPYSAVPNTAAPALTNSPQLLNVPAIPVDAFPFATSKDVTYIGSIIFGNATGSPFVGGTTDLDVSNSSGFVVYTNRELYSY